MVVFCLLFFFTFLNIDIWRQSIDNVPQDEISRYIVVSIFWHTPSPHGDCVRSGYVYRQKPLGSDLDQMLIWLKNTWFCRRRPNVSDISLQLFIYIHSDHHLEQRSLTQHHQHPPPAQRESQLVHMKHDSHCINIDTYVQSCAANRNVRRENQISSDRNGSVTVNVNIYLVDWSLHMNVKTTVSSPCAGSKCPFVSANIYIYICMCIYWTSMTQSRCCVVSERSKLPSIWLPWRSI